jgi:uncharacterized protein (TIGR00251 family)
MQPPIGRTTKDGILLRVYVQPGARVTECTGIREGRLKIRVAAPPVEGAANTELIRFLARKCSIPPTRIRIQSGGSGRHKQILLQCIALDAVVARLNLGSDASHRTGTLVSVLVGLICLGGCSSPQPVLYPNPHLQSVGKETAEQDIEDCQQMAESAGAEESTGKAGRVAKNTAVSGGIGAASGAVGGAIAGSAGTGSLIGLASGAVWGLLSSLFTMNSAPPNEAYTNFVNRCLQDRGYEVTGWQ